MIHKPQRSGWSASIALGIFVLACTGCSEELGPERMVVTRVHGFVRNHQSPVPSGWIEFVPVDGTVGVLCSANIHKDGSFDAARVAVGTNLIRLANAPLGARQAELLFGSYHSPIRRTIAAGSTAPVVIDVFDETVLYKIR